MLYAGIDWSDSALDYELLDVEETVLAKGQVRPDVDGVARLVAEFSKHAVPGEIGIAIETTRGPWIQALVDHGLVVYPINPKTADSHRKSMSASGDKSDAIDAHVLADFLKSKHKKLRPLRKDDPAIAALRIACEDRLRLVEERTAKFNELEAALKTYYPAFLGLFGNLDSVISLSFLVDFPTQRKMQALSAKSFRNFLRRHRYTRTERVEAMIAQLSAPVLPVPDHLQEAKAERIAYLARSVMALKAEEDRMNDEITRQFEALPESAWISSLPGAGPTLGPALLVCIGRDRFATTEQAQTFMGTAPVTMTSGNRRSVFMRQACWKFARRTLQWFAQHSRKKCEWAEALYQRQRKTGHGHYAALRALAHRWLKIIMAMQRTHSRYEEHRFVHSRERHLSGLSALAS